jgi:hypothetical protein
MAKDIITAFTKDDNTAATGLSPTIRIRIVSTNALTVTDDAMTEVGDGLYKYSFAGYDPDVEYAIRCDTGVVAGISNRYSFSSTPDDNTTVFTTITTALTYLQDINNGKWEIVSNQMIFYKSDNATEVMRFDLFDSAGDPAEINVYKRTRV